jgi:hypothetical protein
VMLVGFDFDNTLISYDRLFHKVALDNQLIPETIPPEKNAVRDYLRLQGKEDDWTRLQGEVYGGRILEAEPYPSMHATLGQVARRHIQMRIVSHKTRNPYLGQPWDLHAAASSWLSLQGFHSAEGLDWRKDQIFFELTKENKISRIVELGCTHFVDDLPEILDMLPDNIHKILFAPNGTQQSRPCWQIMTSWQELPRILGLL